MALVDSELLEIKFPTALHKHRVRAGTSTA